MKEFKISDVQRKMIFFEDAQKMFSIDAVCIYSDFNDKSLNKHLIKGYDEDGNKVTDWVEVKGANPFHDFAERLKTMI